MKQIMSLLMILATSLILSSCGSKKNGFEIKNGVNISHWLSQSGNRQPLDVVKSFFTRSDVEYIASLGYDHIRFPIDEVRMFDENGKKIPEAFALLHDALGWCDEFNLRAIVDLHVLRGHSFAGGGIERERPLFADPAVAEKFYNFWRQISSELNKYSVDKVAYEPMNEPVAPNPEKWNTVLNRCIEVIRELEPRRTILMGPNEWNRYNNAKYLTPPENDPNIIISFHYYLPMLLTHHHQARWTIPVHYPGKLIDDADISTDSIKALVDDYFIRVPHPSMVFNIDVMEKQIMEVIEVGKKYNLPVNCGEYGVNHRAPEADKVRWFKDLYTIFERHGISRTNWDYKSNDFGMVRTPVGIGNGISPEGEPQTKMINAIFGKN